MTRSISASRLLSLLETEENAILSGDYSGLAQISEAGLTFAEQLETEQPDDATLRQIAQRAERNMRLLRAATAGIEDARAILRNLEKAPVTEVYDKAGARHAMAAGPTGLERKI
ncbi:hypothetical protein [Natronohydrobacter thiooxidans]|uniref:hypothetical protein n=1 Tax=Natronohydrobacter thiooxidans TaxID=87172 RepID=UPI0008FF447F|nr:hypothetical protein [Natronohydrobacter thiooxidans]